MKNNFYRCYIYGNVMFDLISMEPLKEFHIPWHVTYHHTWRMYDFQTELLMLHAHPESEAYETFDGALYHKKRQTLLYVPKGKETLHIPKHVKEIGYEALKSDRLKTVSIDPDNPFFKLVDGYLYSSSMHVLYFVPPGCSQLFISSTVRYIDDTVFSHRFESVIVSSDNPVYKEMDGVLFRDKDIKYICPNIHSINLHSDANVLSLCGLENANQLREIEISADHPLFRSIDNVVYSKDCTKLVYIPAGIDTIYFSEQLLTLKKGWFEKCANLKEIYIHRSTRFNASCFTTLNKCRIFVYVDAHRSIELPHTSALSLSKCIGFLNGAGAEVKMGTELFYLDCYLSGINRSPEFCHVIQVSSWQIIKRVIEENHILYMKEMISGGYLITRKNINKALDIAMKCGNMEIYELLLSHKLTMK